LRGKRGKREEERERASERRLWAVMGEGRIMEIDRSERTTDREEKKWGKKKKARTEQDRGK
jgi:hypothetical protein